MHRFTYLIVVALGLAGSPANGQATNISTLSLDRRHAVLEDVWATIDREYYNPALKGVDWPAVGVRYRALADSAVTDAEFYRVVRRMLEELHDLHTTYVPPVTSPAQTTGVTLALLDTGVVVTRVDSTALASGVRVGMIVRAANGEAADVRLARLRARLVPSSSPRADDLRLASGFLQLETELPTQLDLVDVTGHSQRSVLEWHQASTVPPLVMRRLASGVAYIHFSALRGPALEEFDRVFPILRAAPGIIIDLRDIPGGDMHGVGAALASRLVNKTIEFGHFIDRNGNTPWFRSLSSKPERNVYEGALVVLVDGATRSAGEVLANGLQESHAATLVGSTTCGCVFDTQTRNVTGGGRLVYSHLAFRSPSGRQLEGDGVTPDTVVKPTARGLADGRDEVLEAAEQVIGRLLDIRSR